MALISSKVAICSVGISCQPAIQLRANVPLIEKLCGEKLEVHTTPFDWNICMPAGAAGMIAARETYPADPNELLVIDGKHFWPRFNCWFWHSKGATSHYPDFAHRQAEMLTAFERIAESERKIFILANSQNNIYRVPQLAKDRLALTTADVIALQSALEDEFGDVELHVVTNPDRNNVKPSKLYGLHVFSVDQSHHDGDPTQWEKLLKELFP